MLKYNCQSSKMSRLIKVSTFSTLIIIIISTKNIKWKGERGEKKDFLNINSYNGNDFNFL